MPAEKLPVRILRGPVTRNNYTKSKFSEQVSIFCIPFTAYDKGVSSGQSGAKRDVDPAPQIKKERDKIKV